MDAPVRVRYAETDAQGVVYHANYVIWFEVGRNEFCEAAGYPYVRMESEGAFITVVEVGARYRRAAKFGDTVLVRTRLAAQRSRGCRFEYEILLPSGDLAVEGFTEHLFLDPAGKPCAMPRAVRVAFDAFLGSP